MFLAHTPKLLQMALPSLLWRVDTDKPVVYLTFDDGPTPGITEWVLDELDKYQAKATFFCMGKNVAAEPTLYQQILDRGHLTGNHTYTHPSGWATSDERYLTEVEQCAELVHSKWFRPPYGRIGLSQIAALKQQYRIVMWDVLSRDYDPAITGNECVANVTNHVQHGSIIVFHDSSKAAKNLRYALPKVLDQLSSKGLIFASLNCHD